MGVINSNGKTDYYAVRLVVQDRIAENPILKEVSVYGKLSAVNAKKIDQPHPRRSSKKNINLKSGDQFEYSVADLIHDVKGKFDDTFSEDVYQHYGMKRSETVGFTEHLRYSERNTNSNRSLLANALETTVQNADEAARLKAYKENIAKYEAKQQELETVRSQLKELYFAKGKRDKDRIEILEKKANRLADSISKYDKALLQLESTSDIKKVLERERKKAKEVQKAKDEEHYKAYRDKVRKAPIIRSMEKTVTEIAKRLAHPSAKTAINECDTAWANSNWEANCRAVSIETSNSATGGDWPVSDAALNSLIRLCADIAKRNKLGKLVKGKNLCWHSMYAATTCPGNYLRSMIDYIAREANKLNGYYDGTMAFSLTL